MWDLPGHGRSPWPDDPVRDPHAAIIGHLDELTGHESALLMGHSLGGLLSLRYALERPGRVSALALIATGPGYRSATSRARWNAQMRRVAARFDIHPRAAELALQTDDGVISRLGEIDVPVLVIAGARDHRLLPASEYLAAALTKATLVVVDDGGHHPHQTHAAEVNDALHTWLQTVNE